MNYVFFTHLYFSNIYIKVKTQKKKKVHSFWQKDLKDVHTVKKMKYATLTKEDHGVFKISKLLGGF